MQGVHAPHRRCAAARVERDVWTVPPGRPARAVPTSAAPYDASMTKPGPDGRMPMSEKDSAPELPVERTGTHVRLREATLSDADVLDARAGDPAMIGEYNELGQPKAKPLAEILANGTRTVGPERGRLLIVRIEDDTIVGDLGWHPVSYGPNERSRALNIGLSLIPEARGHGYGTEAQRLVAELLFDLYDIERVEASTDVDNVAERRSLEKAGFTREGVLRRAQFRAGTHHDLVSYSILRSDIDGGAPGNNF
jgi:RimJ/RimL family protein N-acetyltransferase